MLLTSLLVCKMNTGSKKWSAKYLKPELENRSLKFLITFGSIVLGGSWIIFGFLWYLFSKTRNVSRHNSAAFRNGSTLELEKTCLEEVPNLVEAIIFSVESQTTIGYGTRVMNPGCLDAIVLLMVQLIIGCFIEAIAAGLFSQKLVSKFARRKILKFSNFLTIKKSKNEELILEFKILRLATEPLSKVKVLATVTHCQNDDIDDSDEEDEIPNLPMLPDSLKAQIHFRKYSLPLSYDENCYKTDTEFILFQWPICLYYRIDEQSTLWNLRHKLEDVAHSLVINLTIECFAGHSGTPYKSSIAYSRADFKWSDNDFNVLFKKKDEEPYFLFDGEL